MTAVTRIVVTGPECTGKTTLAAQLATDFGARLLTEMSRTYATEVARPLTIDDVEQIARRAVSAEDAVLTGKPELVVHDTDLLSTIVYGRHYYNFRSPWIEAEARARLGDLYILCLPDIPWAPDGIRDRPDRHAMLTLFYDVLEEFGARVCLLEGLGDERVRTATRAVAAFLIPTRIERFRESAGRDYLSGSSTMNAPTAQTDSAPASSGTLNADALLERMGGSPELLREVATLFLADSPGLIDAIDNAIRLGDANALARIAHSLHGSIANFESGEAAAAARALERMGIAKDLTGAAPQFAKLRHSYSGLAIRLREHADPEPSK